MFEKSTLNDGKNSQGYQDPGIDPGCEDTAWHRSAELNRTDRIRRDSMGIPPELTRSDQ